MILMKKILTLCLALILSVSLSLESLKAHRNSPNLNGNDGSQRIYIHLQRSPAPQQETPEEREQRLRRETEALMQQPKVKATRALGFVVIAMGALDFFESQNAKSGYQPQITPETLYGLLSWSTFKGYLWGQGFKYAANLLIERAEENSGTPAQNRQSRVALGATQLLAASIIFGMHCTIMTDFGSNSEDESTSAVKSFYTTCFGPTLSLISISELSGCGVKNLFGGLTGWW